MIAGQAAEIRLRRQAETDAENPDSPTSTTSEPTGAIAEFRDGQAPTIRGVIPIRQRTPNE